MGAIITARLLHCSTGGQCQTAFSFASACHTLPFPYLQACTAGAAISTDDHHHRYRPPTTHLLYLHGFRSSPQSAKARLMAAHVAQHHPSVQFWSPQLPPSPRAAMELVRSGIAGWPQQRMAVVGSSLGGYYASWVAQQMRCPSVLLNPAVNPAHTLAHYIGEQTQWHAPDEQFYFAPEFVAELRALDVRDAPPAAPQLAIIAKGDEVLDWREMVARYPQAQRVLLEGGDHALSDFASHIEKISQFLNLAK